MNKLYNDTAVQAIANAIRAKNGSSDTYTIAEMSDALNDLSYYAKPTISDVPLATFEADGLPLNSLKVSVEAKQDLHGYDHPWVGGAGKNKLPMTVSGIKAANTSGTWSDNTYTLNGVTFTIQTDTDGNVVGIKVNGTASSTAGLNFLSNAANNYIGQILNCDGVVGSPASIAIQYFNGGTFQKSYILPDSTRNYEIEDVGDNINIFIRIESGYTANNLVFKPMVRLASESATFAPYSNICPISGWSEVVVSDVDDVDNPTVTQTTTIALPQTVYGAEVDVVNGILKITDGYIASYDGETLPSTWISSMDEYAEGTSPTTGAEVCYELANPIIINLTPTLIKSLNGINNLSVDCGDVIELEYFKEV